MFITIYGARKMADILKVHSKKCLPATKEYFLLTIPRENDIILFSILIFVIIAGFIVSFCKIDDVVKAKGIVRVRENVSSVENMVSGKISAIYFERGQKVEAGDTLYTMDTEMLDLQKKNLVRQEKDIEQKLNDSKLLRSSLEANKNLCGKSNQKAWYRFETYLNQKKELEIRLSLALTAYKLEKEKPLAFTNQTVLEQKEMELNYARSALEAFVSNFSSTINSEVYEYDLALERNRTEKEALSKQYEYLNVTAPVSGFVQEFSSLNVGDFLEKGAKVVNIIPDNSSAFRVEISVAPKDMGKIGDGLSVKYRLPAFPFFEYKGAEGKITSVDPDIRKTADEKYYYCVYADIDKSEFANRKGKSYPIKSGLEAEARIVLERDTILKLFLRKMDFLN